MSFCSFVKLVSLRLDMSNVKGSISPEAESPASAGATDLERRRRLAGGLAVRPRSCSGLSSSAPESLFSSFFVRSGAWDAPEAAAGSELSPSVFAWSVVAPVVAPPPGVFVWHGAWGAPEAAAAGSLDVE